MPSGLSKYFLECANGVSLDFTTDQHGIGHKMPKKHLRVERVIGNTCWYGCEFLA